MDSRAVEGDLAASGKCWDREGGQGLISRRCARDGCRAWRAPCIQPGPALSGAGPGQMALPVRVGLWGSAQGTRTPLASACASPLFPLWPQSPTLPKRRYPFSFFLSFFFFLLFLPFSRAVPMAHGSSQARGQSGAVASSLCQSHSNMGSEPHLQPTPELMATPDPSPTEQGRGPNPQPHGS